MDRNIQNRKTILSTTIPFAFGEKSPMNFGSLTTELGLDMWVWTHPNQLFGRPYFGPYRGRCRLKFAHAGDWPRLPSAHPIGDGGPPTIFNNEHSKFCL